MVRNAVKSGLTNDDLIRLYEVFAPTHALLHKRPHPPENLNREEAKDWYENNEESKAWEREYACAGRQSSRAYLRLRWQIGKRIGAHLIATTSGPYRTPVSVSVYVFPRAQFPTRAAVRKVWNISGIAHCEQNREEFPAGDAFIYSTGNGQDVE